VWTAAIEALAHSPGHGGMEDGQLETHSERHSVMPEAGSALSTRLTWQTVMLVPR
jgi:hypothetical protein